MSTYSFPQHRKKAEENPLVMKAAGESDETLTNVQSKRSKIHLMVTQMTDYISSSLLNWPPEVGPDSARIMYQTLATGNLNVKPASNQLQPWAVKGQLDGLGLLLGDVCRSDLLYTADFTGSDISGDTGVITKPNTT